MTKTILLVVRTPSVAEDVMARVHVPGVRLLGSSTKDEVKAAFAAQRIDHVIFGGGKDVEERLEIIRDVFAWSNATTVHLNSPSGPQSFLPFVEAVVAGIKDL